MSGTISWVHIGDLHADEADDWQGIARLERIVDDLAAVREGIDFVYLPGDNANHATAEQYRRIRAALAPLALPVFAIPGDHDFEDGTLAAYRAGLPEAMRPFDRVIAGHRCLFLDMVSAGTGGPDFRIGAGQRRRIEAALAEADDAGVTPLVFMHAYPSDLSAGGEALATLFADAGVAFVDTGHTHYNELLNDGRTVYGATRSTAQIEEDGGEAGYAIVSVHDRVPSWTFRPIGQGAPGWPHVQILSPADMRLATRIHDPRHVPAPGAVDVVARLLGPVEEAPVAEVGGERWPMRRVEDMAATWHTTIVVGEPGLHALTVRSGAASDTIDVLVRGFGKDRPKRVRPVAPGNAVHAIGAWPSRRILGTQLGPNKNGCGW
ncbi:metallophosphoesterase [Sphingomonas sp. KR1UV-12]|uniref:Metallophosphoesterase n=1 Tax=Sphingomonas aurea TaxID=3063994 RepID=A0ABT9EKV6_9SPHN|nr:metallophosphoesterase [Sphingomonas sp. KR1UV-12]MDP1027576.1 metallophosphoesterase [Sphingomonas sp. KR1UV-12]